MRRTVFTGLTSVVLASACVAAVAGCMPSTLSGSAPAGPIVVVTDPRGLTTNPYSPRLADRRIGRLLFRGLLVTGPDGLPAPDLALEVPTVANGGIRDGGRTVTYRIRDGVEWNDGGELTARDVAFTINAIAEGRLTDDPGEDFTKVSGAEATDERTVRVSFSKPDSVMAWRLAPYVLPEHLLGDSPDIAGDAYWDDPVGSGPYRVASSKPGGQVDLEPVASGAVPLRIKPFELEAEATREFTKADTAVWLGTVLQPAGAAESLSTTYGPVWRRIILFVGEDSPWSDPALRRAFVGMTTVTVPADLPARAYPYGVKPKKRAPDTRAAEAAFEAAGYRRDPRTRSMMRGGRRLDMVMGVGSLRQEQERHTNRMQRLWETSGGHFAIVALTVPIRPTWLENGDLARARKEGFLLAYPEGRPVGWAFPYVKGDAPSFKHPWGLNISHLSDDRVQAAYEAARTAPDPQTARAGIAKAGKRVYELAVEVPLEPVPERVLYKGVTGVSAWPVQDEALAQASAWKRGSSRRAGQDPAGGR